MTEPIPRRDEELLERLVAGEELSAEEHDRLRSHASLADRADALGGVQSLLDELGSEARTTMLGAEGPAPGEEDVEQIVADYGSRPRRIRRPWVWVAAVAALVLAAFLIYEGPSAKDPDPDAPFLMHESEAWTIHRLRLTEDGGLLLSWEYEKAPPDGLYDVYLWNVGATDEDDPLFPPAENLEEDTWILPPERVELLPATFRIEVIAWSSLRDFVANMKSPPCSLPR